MATNKGRLIKALVQGGGFGRDLMKISGLKPSELAGAVDDIPPSILTVKGSLSADSIADSYIVISSGRHKEAMSLID